MYTTFLIEQNTSLYKALFQAAQEHNFPAAFWRLSQSSEIHFIADLSGTTIVTNALDLEESPSGFAFSPFHNPDGKSTRFIKADVHYVLQNGHFLVSNQEEEEDSLSDNKQAFQETVNRLLNNSQASLETTKGNGLAPIPSSKDDRDYFTDMVARARRAIVNGNFQKVVLSRTKEVPLPEKFDIASAFADLCEIYPQAFVSWVFVPGIGTWIGVSPETLICIDKNKIFKTVSLAGTQPYRQDIPVSRAVWTQKEIEEQALVSRYIVNCFKKIRLREYDEIGPRSVVAGNLMHLRTDFTVNILDTDFPRLGTIMLGLLHPTSAVCGTPKETALAFIEANERHNRAFYSGFLGPVNISGESHLFVNLRCMQIQTDKAILYAGAGVTSDSNPEREWAETELKCQTLLKVLEKS